MKPKLVTLVLTLILFFLFATPALAQGPDGSRVVFGEDLVLQPEETIDGDVAVFGGNLTVPADSEINGDLAVFGGNATVNGKVDGDIAMIGGNISLGESAEVDGNIGLVGGNASMADGAEVRGNISNFNHFGIGEAFEEFGQAIPTPVPPVPPVAPETPATPVPPVPPHWDEPDWGREWDGPASEFAKWVSHFVGHVVGMIALLLAMAAISWLVAAFLPEQMRLVGDTLVESPPISFVVGLVTIVLAGLVGLILVITICLAFIPALGGLVLAIAMLFGWIAAGQVIGERLMMASGRPVPNFVFSTVLGVTVLTVITKMPILSQIPCLGFILGLVGGVLGFVVSMAGLGAVILTRFGTQPYTPNTHSYQPNPPANPGPVAPREPRRPASYTSPLDRSEAELRAKIKAALAEADADASKPAPAQPVSDDQPIDDEPLPGDPGVPDKPIGDEPVAEDSGDVVPPTPAEPPSGDLPLETPTSRRKKPRRDDDPEELKTGD